MIRLQLNPMSIPYKDWENYGSNYNKLYILKQSLSFAARLLRIFFPTLVKEEAYKFFYSKVGQYISVANYWNDPHHQSLYLKHNKFLPFMNNEASAPFNLSSDHKSGITKLNKLVLIGGPDDEIIEPWQSRYTALRKTIRLAKRTTFIYGKFYFSAILLSTTRMKR